MAIVEQHKVSDTQKLIKVNNSKVWQLRFKDPTSNKWLTRSTKQTDLHQALLSVSKTSNSTTKTFLDIFNEWTKLQPNRRKESEYINTLHTYALPTLGELPIDGIKQKDISRLLSERFNTFYSKYKREPSKSTVLNWNSAINLVFGYAIEQDYVHHTQLPKLTNVKQGTPAKQRIAFTDQQLQALIKSDFFHKPTKNKKTRLIRELLRNYITLLLHSGIRHGTETDNLNFEDIDTKTDKNDTPYLIITIRKGKTTLYTGSRKAVVNDDGFHAIHDIIDTYKKHEIEHPKRILGDTTPNRMQESFKQLLKYVGIDYTQGYSLYSLRHTYITNKLKSGVNLNLIATQCGTSAEMIERHYKHLNIEMSANELLYPDNLSLRY